MKNVNKVLRKKCFDLLNGNLTVEGEDVPIYYKYIPNTVDKPFYLIIRTVNNSDHSNFQRNKTNTSIQFGLYSKDTVANSGDAIEEMADQIYSIIYPTSQSKIDLTPDFNAACLKLENDISPDAFQTDNAIFINRFITFSFDILHIPI